MEQEEKTLELEYSVEDGVVYKVTREPVVNTETRLSEVRNEIASKQNELSEIQNKLAALQEEENQLINIAP